MDKNELLDYIDDRIKYWEDGYDPYVSDYEKGVEVGELNVLEEIREILTT